MDALIKNNGRLSGFSLLEGILCLFILAVTLNLASTSFLGLGPKYRLQRAVWQIRSRFNYARYRAVFDRRKFRVKIYSQSCSVEYYDESSKKWLLAAHDYLEGISLSANNIPVFHPAGTVSNLATVYLSNSSGKYKITLAITGRLKTVWIPP
ncbi:MAG: hypothetical protein JXB26_13025 [Candidatus Aminicenantes bacterium]|nr:hypothetical protein [Candidatus Aminicenantes bacterium]